MFRIKIISDGKHTGTRVVNADTGEELAGVVYVAWKWESPFHVPTAVIEINRAVIEAEVVPEKIVNIDPKEIIK